jgi:hypothetical protein
VTGGPCVAIALVPSSDSDGARPSGERSCRGEAGPIFHRLGIAIVVGVIASLGSAPAAWADTCCANRAVTFVPSPATVGETVRIDGIVCLAPDNSGPLPLVLRGAWLSQDRIPAEADPATTPGDPRVHPATDLPGDDGWLSFESVTGAGMAAAGSATITVPGLASGSYQLWWRCDNGGGPGSGIHYSGGPRLTIRSGGPATDLAGTVPTEPPLILALLVWLAGFLAALVVLGRRDASRRRQGR